MEWARLTKAGGELIKASSADYEDYRGFLKCPECDHEVFLRKAHIREGVPVGDAFVHHKAVPEISACKLRVGNYSKEYIESKNAEAKGQRLRRLVISMWKYLKTNITMDLKRWPTFTKQVESNRFLLDVVEYGETVLDSNQEFILDNTFPKVADLIVNRDPRIAVVPEKEQAINRFLKGRSRDWELHCKIAREALDLFLKSNAMKEIRYRLCCCMAHPTALAESPDLLDLDTSTDEWRKKFVAHITLVVTFVFLTVDWIEIFKN